MTDYFKDPNEALVFYKIDDFGKIFELDIYSGQWDDVSDYEEYNHSWEQVTEAYVNSFRLFIYVEQSNRYFQEHKEDVGIKTFKYGDDFTFYVTNEGIIAVDENHIKYICDSRIMVPSLKIQEKIPDDWTKLSLDTAIEYIECQNSIFLSDMDTYFDDEGNVQGYDDDGRQFCLNLKTHHMDIVYDKFGPENHWKKCYPSDPLFDNEENEIILSKEEYDNLDKLNKYLDLSKKNNMDCNFGKIITFYENYFRKVMAKDENGIIYECKKNYMVPTSLESLENFVEYPRYYIVDDIISYYDHYDALPTKEIVLRDLMLFRNKQNMVVGITEDKRKYKLSFETGEIEKIDFFPNLDDNWEAITRKEGMYIQGCIKYALSNIKEKKED